MDEFDEMLISIVDRVMKCSPNEENVSIVLERARYFAKKSRSLTEIPQNLSLFSLELIKVLDSEESLVRRSRAKIKSSVEIIEQTILRMSFLRIAKARTKLMRIRLGELSEVTSAGLITKPKKASHENGEELQTAHVLTNGGGDT